MSKVQVIAQYIEFARANKKYWLVPVVFILLAFGIVLVMAQGSALAPFIYSVF
jgi:hypothetical protein